MTMAVPAAGHGQSWRQVGELLLEFGLSSVIGLERQFRGKSAGLRTQTIVGTASALIMLVSKYGFNDVLSRGAVILDPSRIAAQIVTGIGFLGAGLIVNRRGAIRSLYRRLSLGNRDHRHGRRCWPFPARSSPDRAALRYRLGLHPAGTPDRNWWPCRTRGHTITCEDGGGVLRDLLATCTAHAWTLNSLAIIGRPPDQERTATADTAGTTGSNGRRVTVGLTLTGLGATQAAAVLGGISGVFRVDLGDDEDE